MQRVFHCRLDRFRSGIREDRAVVATRPLCQRLCQPLGACANRALRMIGAPGCEKACRLREQFRVIMSQQQTSVAPDKIEHLDLPAVRVVVVQQIAVTAVVLHIEPDRSQQAHQPRLVMQWGVDLFAWLRERKTHGRPCARCETRSIERCTASWNSRMSV